MMDNAKCGRGCATSMVIKILVIIGGINWGLVGVGMLMGSDWNVVHMLLGSWPMVEAIVYIIVGLAAIAKIFHCKCKKCMAACAACVNDSKMAEGKMGGGMM